MLSPTDENYQKALGYVQLLKLEGKLDEQAIPELKRMYNLSQEEAEDVLNTFKTEKQGIYKAQIWNNIKWSFGLLCFFAIVATFYFFLGKESDQFFKLLAIFLAVSGIGIIIYIIKLLTERIKLREVNKERGEAPKIIHAPAKIVVRIVCIIIVSLGAFMYLGIYGKYSSDIRSWLQVRNVVLEKDCFSDKTTGKNSLQYYEFKIEGNSNQFIWWQDQHYYSFKNNFPNPDMYFHKGDTITLWIDREDYLFDIGNEKRIRVYDVAKQEEEPVLDLKKRDNAAGNALERQVWITVVIISGAIFLSGIVKNK